MQHEPITLESAGRLLGGERPLSRRTVERMIAAKLLPDYGRGATRRVLRADVERLITRLAAGEVTWPVRKNPKNDATRHIPQHNAVSLRADATRHATIGQRAPAD